jgi:hypothetical protein
VVRWCIADDQIRLSILLDKDRIWVGLSRVLEFEEIPNRQTYDFVKLEKALKEHKASADFTDRYDAELAADGGVTAGDVLSAFDVACKVGFIDLAVLPRAQLSAGPALDNPTDHLQAR